MSFMSITGDNLNFKFKDRNEIPISKKQLAEKQITDRQESLFSERAVGTCGQ